MPLYDYRCDTCGLTFDRFVPVDERDGQTCRCGSDDVSRVRQAPVTVWELTGP